MRKGPVIAVLVTALLAGGTVVGLKVRADRAAERDRREALQAATSWLVAWQDGRYDDIDPLTGGGDAPGAALRRTDQRLQVTRKVLIPGALSADGREVPYTAAASLSGLGELTWAGRVRVSDRGGSWRVAFDAPTVHPALGNGQRLDRRTRSAPRAAITDRKGRAVRPASADLAGNVLGRPATAGAAATGLERVLADQLAGRDAGSVVVADAASGAQVREVQRFAGKAPQPVRTTLDLDVQRAAESVLSGLTSAGALVAVDSATGQVRAAASRPVRGKPQAFTSYAPGSVFKVVTAAALLENGLQPSSPVQCPPSYRGTKNASSVVPGPSTLARAFAQSCNAAFLSQADALPPGALAAAARRLGFEQDLLPIATDRGSFPTGGGSADATGPIGQGRVEATPLLMATVLAAADSGSWRKPSLVPGPAVAGTPLAPAVARGLRQMLRTAVESGSGTAVDLPGAPVSGKTGSAEVGSAGQVHAWFCGYRSGLAFCVFVESGESGGATAAPVAARFLRALS